MKQLVIRRLVPVAALTCWLLVAFDGLSGAEFRADDRPAIKSDEVVEDDLYIFGDEVTIDGEVQGDVIAFGRLIRLNGTVDGDFIAAGQAIVITGRIADDVRIAGQVLRIDENASIGDDLIGAAFSLEFAEASTIDADLVYAGYQALLGGDIGGSVKGGMANCEIAGHIGGDVDLSVDGDQAGVQAYTAGSPPPVSLPNVPAGLTIRDTAQIDGALNYKSREEANIESDAQINGEIKQERPQAQTIQPPTPTEKALCVVSQYASLLIIGMCILLIAPAWTRSLSDNIKTRPLASFGFGAVGFVGFIVLPLVILVGMVFLAVIAGFVNLTSLVPVVIVLGLTVGVMLVVGFWFFTTYLAEIILSVFAGRWLLGLAKPSLGENRFLSFTVGLVLLALISSIPYFGPIVGWLVVLFGLGALLLWLFRKRPLASTAFLKPETTSQ